METCDVAIVGGGPAGSTCAWKLRQAGLDVLVIDKARFPRDKTCTGWITPQVVEALLLDIAEYASRRVFQPIDGFYVALFGQSGLGQPGLGSSAAGQSEPGRTDIVPPGIRVRFPQPVSYGIRRCEFDDYLLRRSGARLRLDEPVRSLERTAGGWLLNGSLEARMLVGAGGHFCPVARWMRSARPGGDRERSHLVTALEAEFPIPSEETASRTEATVPRLYFRDDLSGYGWCVRKGDYLNVGLGLVDSRESAADLPRLLGLLDRERAYAGAVPVRFHGHAYYLYDGCRSEVFDDAVLLIGDAAGLAYPQSGEGIRPAVESGILAAGVIAEAGGRYEKSRLAPYRERLVGRLGAPPPQWLGAAGVWPLPAVRKMLVRQLLRIPWFVRNTVIRDSFLHAREPALFA